jgi:hypothetical protein
MAFVVKSPTNHLPPALRIPECPQVARSTPSLALLQIPGRSGKNWGGKREVGVGGRQEPSRKSIFS